MAIDNDWSGVFLQALQNSLAQSSANSKWNRELEFRNKEFETRTQQWEKDYASNQEQNRTTFLSNFVKAPENWSALKANTFGAPIRSSFGDSGVDYIPSSALANWREGKKAMEEKDIFYRTNYTPDEYIEREITPLEALTLGMVNASKVNAEGLFPSDAETLYDFKPLNDGFYKGGIFPKATIEKAITEQSNINTVREQIAQQERNSLRDYGARMYGIEMENKRYQDAQRGYYVVNGDKTPVYTTPDAILASDPKAVFKRVDNGYDIVQYERLKKDLNPMLNAIPNTAEGDEKLLDFIQYAMDKNIDVTQIPGVYSTLQNKANEIQRAQYNANPPSNLWGQLGGVFDKAASYLPGEFSAIGRYVNPIGLLTAITPKEWGQASYSDWSKEGGYSDKLGQAKSFLSRMPPTGVNASVILGQGE